MNYHAAARVDNLCGMLVREKVEWCTRGKHSHIVLVLAEALLLNQPPCDRLLLAVSEETTPASV